MPSEAVELIVHGPPGSGPDGLARALKAAASEAGRDPRPWELVFRGDDPGPEAMRALLEQTGRENVISTCTPVFLQAPLLRNLPFTYRDLTPIARLVVDRYLVIASPNAPFTSGQEFVQSVRTRKTRTGGYFLGSINHLLGVAVAETVGGSVEFQRIKSEIDLVPAIIEGRIDWGLATPVEVLSHIETGALRPLVAVDSARLPRFPDVPTLGEVAGPLTFVLWRGLVAPPGISAEARAHWVEILGSVIHTTAWRDYLTRYSQDDAFLPGEAFRAFLDEQNTWFETELARAGLIGSQPREQARR
jgi:putative tricarboxylic transport membrane protein